jgi:hypothetical protein
VLVGMPVASERKREGREGSSILNYRLPAQNCNGIEEKVIERADPTVFKLAIRNKI